MKPSNRPVPPRSAFIIAIAIVTVIAFFPVFSNHFINFDDPGYVTNNAAVQSGISVKTIIWSFTTIKESNWHPLTWISHALDCSLFGLDERFHHAMNLLLHILSSIFLFLVFDGMTQARWKSAFVAIVFAVHPLHVESVAWIAERKDVLSALFWMLTMLAYAKYLRSPGVTPYLLALASFALGLLAKPMLVTLPFVLLLLNYWPLGSDHPARESGASSGVDTRRQITRCIIELIPFVLLSIASSVITYIVQEKGGSMGEASVIPMSSRIANAVVSYVQYVRKVFLPNDLAVFYPHPLQNLPMWETAGAALFLLVVSVFVWMWRKKHRCLLVGWLWFLGSLVPVIGIVQVGLQSMADRYMYIPIIGLSIMIAWGIPPIFGRLRLHRFAIVGIASIVVLLMVFGTHVQAEYWSDNVTLYEHALAVTTDNHLAQTNLGTALADADRNIEAIPHLREAFRLRPNEVLVRSNLARSLAAVGARREAMVHYDWLVAHVAPDPRLHLRMGDALASDGRIDDAISHYREALRLDSNDVLVRCKLAELYSQQSRFDEALKECSIALALDPRNCQVYDVLGIVAGRRNDTEEAMKEFSQAIRCDSANADAYNDFGILYDRLGRKTDALAMYRAAVRINPRDADAQFNLGTSLAQSGNLSEAADHWNDCLSTNPTHVNARLNLGRLFTMQGNIGEAVRQYAMVLQMDSNNVQAHFGIGNLLARAGKFAEAEVQFNKVLRLDPSSQAAQEALQQVRARKGQ